MILWLAFLLVWIVLGLWVVMWLPTPTGGRYGKAWYRWYRRSVYINLTWGSVVMAGVLTGVYTQ